MNDGRRETTAFDIGPKGRAVLLDATPDAPDEIYALERGKERPLSKQNDAWLADVEQGALEEITVTSRDGTRINGFMLKPPGYRAGIRYPTLLQIHGGPVSQYANSFNLSWQILAARGFVVVAANPRGSSGRGEEFAKAIFAAWGEKDTEDVARGRGLRRSAGHCGPESARRRRLELRRHSHGQRDHTRPALQGRGQRRRRAGNALAGYGTDMYVREYELENSACPGRISTPTCATPTPFLHADRIVTPTLFMCGEKDFNVPLLNSEQMYQAVRSVGVDTQLIIYPGQFHGSSRAELSARQAAAADRLVSAASGRPDPSHEGLPGAASAGPDGGAAPAS